jgi:hypothetical protein
VLFRSLDGILAKEDFLHEPALKGAAKLRRDEEILKLAREAPEFQMTNKHQHFVNKIGQSIDDLIAANMKKSGQAARDSSKKLSGVLKKTLGMAPPVGAPMSPKLPPAQGMAERAGDFLEKPLLGGKFGVRDIAKNPLAQLSALKFITGAKTAPLAGAYMGLKGLTSPSVAGEVSRLSFKQAGIAAIVQMASRYPSYHDGVIENPQERRSLAKEIEDDPEIPIEQKALLQTTVHRGKPLGQRLQ